MRAKLTMDQGVTGATALQQSSAKLTTCTTSTSVPRQYLRLGRVLGINLARLATQLAGQLGVRRTALATDQIESLNSHFVFISD